MSLVCGAAVWCQRIQQMQAARRYLMLAALRCNNHGNQCWYDSAARRAEPCPVWRVAVSSRTLTSTTTLLKKARKDQHSMEETVDNICLLGPDHEDLGVMTKAEAEARGLQDGYKLVLIDDARSGVVYQLMTNNQLTEEQKRLREHKKATKKKAEKTLRISSKITDHDLDTKTKHAIKWLEKGHQVKVQVKSSKPEHSQAQNKIWKYMCDQAAALATVQEARRDSAELVFHLRPKDAESSDTTDREPLMKHQDLKKAQQQNAAPEEK